MFYCLDGPSEFCRTSKDLTAMWRRGGVLKSRWSLRRKHYEVLSSQTYFLGHINEYLGQSNYCWSHCDTNNANQACLEIERVQSGAEDGRT